MMSKIGIAIVILAFFIGIIGGIGEENRIIGLALLMALLGAIIALFG